MIRRGRQPLVAALVAAATAALTFATLSTAAAAQLGVSGGAFGSYSDEACTTDSVATTLGSTSTGANYTSIELSNLPDSCAGLPIELVVYDNTGTSIGTGTGTAPGAPVPAFDVTTTSYKGSDADGVALLVDTWHVPTTWTGTTPTPAYSCVAINPAGNPTGQSCTVTLSGSHYWLSYPGAWGVGQPYYHTYLRMSVTTARPWWRVTIDLSDPSMPAIGFTPVLVNNSTNATLAPGYSCNSLPWITIDNEQNDNAGYASAQIYYTSDPSESAGVTTLCDL